MRRSVLIVMSLVEQEGIGDESKNTNRIDNFEQRCETENNNESLSSRVACRTNRIEMVPYWLRGTHAGWQT